MEDLIVFIVSFTIVLIVHLVLYFTKKKKKTLYKMREFDFLRGKYKLEKINYQKSGLIICFLNSFIISATGTLCTMINLKYQWQILIGFVALIVMIYIVYGIYGNILKRKEDKNEHKTNRRKVAKKMGRK